MQLKDYRKCSISGLNNRNGRKKYFFGQVTVEFTLCTVIVLVLMYGCIKALRWIGLTLAERRDAFDKTLIADINVEHWPGTASPLKQLNPNFYKERKMGLVFDNW